MRKAAVILLLVALIAVALGFNPADGALFAAAKTLAELILAGIIVLTVLVIAAHKRFADYLATGAQTG